ncbi:uncharacterized protein LOC118436722 isoform X1 [Folsomia candida]|uniref:uncharacterized protein LOC118436722 isoform X1 n=1 Tax=Folsomia candida TaxID=158441 RepID=UPI001604F6D0|nr:uncharacterized protein LOC118436722 isoform X1 [Folsomia candida]
MTSQVNPGDGEAVHTDQEIVDLEHDSEGGSKEPKLVKQPGFEKLSKFRFFFEKQFSYLGHSIESQKFFSTCKKCTETGKKSRVYSFGASNFNVNGNRHYRNSHKDVSLEIEIPRENHKVNEFFHSNQNKYNKNEPIQSKFNSNLQDLVSVDGLPFSFVNWLGFRNLVSDLNPRVIVPDRVTLARKLANTVNKILCNFDLLKYT